MAEAGATAQRPLTLLFAAEAERLMVNNPPGRRLNHKVVVRNELCLRVGTVVNPLCAQRAVVR